MFLNIVREEEQLQHDEDNEELLQDNKPKRPPYCHTAESVVVQVPYPLDGIHLSRSSVLSRLTANPAFLPRS